MNYDVGKIESKTEYNNNKLSKMKFIQLQKSVQLQQKSGGLQHIYIKYIVNIFKMCFYRQRTLLINNVSDKNIRIQERIWS